VKAAVYCRISDDRGEEGLGVERQRADCLALVEAKGWTLESVYTDNDVSASKGKPRPAYREMMAKVASGSVGVIVALRADRLYRYMPDLVEFVTVVRAAKVDVALVKGSDVRLDTADGRQQAYIMGSIAAGEAEKIGERVQRKHQELIANGYAKGGGRRAFGFTPDGRYLVPDEAAVIRKMANWLLAGTRVNTVVRSLNDAGIKPARGERWTHRSVKQVMTASRIAGLLVYHGADAGKSATYKPIVSAVELERLREIIRPGAPTNRQRQLLTRFLHCEANHPMGSAGPSYVCLVCSPTQTVYRPKIEALVTAEVLAHINELETDEARREAVAEDADAEPETVAVSDRDQLAELEAMWAAKEIDGPTWLRLRKPITERIEARDRAAEHAQFGIAVQSIQRRAAEWETLDLDQRRNVLAHLIVRVTVSRGPVGTRFDASRVRIEWSR
jgi:DNA invertase Pin-like site-specific DNA recombinase